MTAVPIGWIETSLIEIAFITMGQSPDGEFTNTIGVGVPLIGGAADFEDGELKVNRYTSQPTKISEVGDLVLSIRATIGKVAFADKKYCLGRGVAGLRPHVEPKWLFYKLLESAKGLFEAGTGSTFRQIDKKTLEQWPITLPPLEEQKRISSKIDSLTRRSKNVGNLLDRIPRLVERYKQTILEKAFYEEINNISEKSLLIPKKSLGEVITSIKSGKNLKCEERPPLEDERGVLKVSAVTWGSFNPKASKTLPQDYSPPEGAKVKNGDFLFSRANTIHLIGAVVIVENAPDNLYLSDKILRLEMADEDKPWILWFLRSPLGRAALEKKASGNQESMRNISQSALLAITVPWPPTKTRLSIVSQIETRFKLIEQVALATSDAYKLIDDLYESILSKAFRGNLVPQDSNDKPALNLLQDIRLEKQLDKKPQKNEKPIKVMNAMPSKRLIQVLAEAEDWLTAQEAFRRCGINQNATTEEIEPIYSELRSLDEAGNLNIEVIRDKDGRKLYDKIKMSKRDNHEA